MTTEMKKIAKYFLAALALSASVSCVKELADDFKPVKLQGNSYVFTATFDETDTKTVLDENTMESLWYGDENGKEYITVMEPNSVNTYVAEGITEPTTSATFKMAENGGSGLTGKAAFAVYPAGNWSCFSTADSSGVRVTYPHLQNARKNSYDPNAAVAIAYNPDVEADQRFSFMNATSLLKFQIQNTSDPVYNVTVYSLGGEPISGDLLLMQKGEERLISASAEGTKNWVELSDAELLPLETETTYYIAVAPALLKEGIAIQLNKDEMHTFTISKEIKIERNKIYDLGRFSYTAPEEEVWYLIGDFNAGNINSITHSKFEPSGEDYLVAKNIPITSEQAFKIYNPLTGESLFADVEAVKANEWYGLSSGKGNSYTTEGTYDFYIDYIDKKVSGVALVEPGQEIPAFPAPKGQFVWYFDDEAEWGGAAYHKALDINTTEEGVIYVARNYTEYATNPETGEFSEWYDFRLVDLWEAPEVYTDFTIVPEGPAHGQIRMKAVVTNWIGTSTQYFLMLYSNYDGNSIDIFSPSQFVDENYDPIYPVFDENGNAVLDADGFVCYYSGNGICELDENWVSHPLHMELSEEVLTVVETPTDLPIPEGQFVWLYDDEAEYGGPSYNKVFDLGITEPGNILMAKDYDASIVDPETGETAPWADPSLSGLWAFEVRYSDYKLTPYYASSGEITFKAEISNWLGTSTQYFMIKYSNYDGKSISLYSPSQITDDWGEPIPVYDENYDQVLDAEGFPCYYNGIGLCETDENWNTLPVSMVLSDEFLEIGMSYPTAAQYVWYYDDEAEYGGPAYTKVFDLGFTEPGTIYIGKNYDESMTNPETGEIEYADPRMLGTWAIEQTFSDYEIIPTDSYSGEIRFKAEVTNWFGTSTQYFLIKYSNYSYGSGIALYSPSQWVDENYDNLYPVLDENGNPVLDAEGFECYYQGVGLCELDESYNTYPMMLMAAEEEIALTEEPATPDDAQWIFTDPAVYQYFQGDDAEARTLLNLGAVDFSALGGEQFAGKFIHLAYSQEDVYGPDAEGCWQAMPILGYATPYTIKATDSTSGVIEIQSYDFFGDLQIIEIPYAGHSGGQCYFDFSAYGLEGYQPAYVASPVDLLP